MKKTEPSIQEVTKTIIEMLHVNDPLGKMHVAQIVWNYGRTNSMMFCHKALQATDSISCFFQLLEEQGIKKERKEDLFWQKKEVSIFIADQLEEKENAPRFLLLRSVSVLGIDEALCFLKKAQTVEQNGGMMTIDGSRRRTKGGVFFRLIKEAVTKEQKKQIFLLKKKQPKKPAEKKMIQSKRTPFSTGKTLAKK